MSDTMSATGAAALAYANRGWSVLPLHGIHRGRCACAKPDCKPGKHPVGALVKRGFKDATTDTDVVARWWTKYPDANVGIVTGVVSGFVVLDVDPRHGGDASLVALQAQHGLLPETVESLTGGGGRHVFFAYPGGTIRNRVALAPGLDVRAEGGYVAAPPSVHVSGQHYSWKSAHGPDDVLFAALPGWLATLICRGSERDRGEIGGADCIPDGQRNSALTSLAGAMRRKGMTESEIVAALHAVNAGRCVPRLRDEEVAQIAASVGRYEPSNPANDDPSSHLTDLGNARRLVATHGADIRYCPAWRTWLVWDGRRWVRDTTLEVMRRAKETVQRFYVGAVNAPESERRTKLLKHALNSEKAERLAGMVKLAQSEPGIPVLPHELDARSWSLNVQNGTLDLRTGVLRPHCRADLLTKLAPVAFEAEASSETWEKFLHQATSTDDELSRFLQRAVGYSLTGDTSAEVLFFIHGPEATGKSTFIEAIKAVLGDYASTADFEAFLVRPHVGAPRNDIARLAGARLVASVEVDEGKKLAQGLVKQLTGGDSIAARFLYQEHFEFRPQFKLWLAANHVPRVAHHDGALWRRILRVPFERTIPRAERDPSVKATLTSPPISGSAILAWAVKGCIAWQQQGLGVPPAVTTATAAYRADMDPLKEFVAECCVLVPEAVVAVSNLWAAYTAWAKEYGERTVTRPAFADGLRARGCTAGKGAKGVRVWRGVGLVDGRVAQVASGGANTEKVQRNESRGELSRNPCHPTPSAPPDTSSDKEAAWYGDFEDRAAILEYDAGLPRAEAERCARAEVHLARGRVS